VYIYTWFPYRHPLVFHPLELFVLYRKISQAAYARQYPVRALLQQTKHLAHQDIDSSSWVVEALNHKTTTTISPACHNTVIMTTYTHHVQRSSTRKGDTMVEASRQMEESLVAAVGTEEAEVEEASRVEIVEEVRIPVLHFHSNRTNITPGGGGGGGC
jgi:hypothetical protein